MLIPSRLRGHIQQYNLFELLRDRSYDRNLGFLAHSRSEQGIWSRCESLWYLYDFNAGLVSCVEAIVEPGPKRVDDNAVLEDCMFLEVHIISVEGDSMSLAEAKSPVRQFWATQHPPNLEESPAAAPEGVGSTNVLAGDLDGETDWDLASWTGDPDLGN